MKRLIHTCLLLLCLVVCVAGYTDIPAPSPALQAKLAVLKARGLDYSGALAFWPLGDGDGILSCAYGTLGKDNPYLLSTAVLDAQWVKESRFKGQYALRCSPPNSTVNGGGRRIFNVTDDAPLVAAYTIEGWCRPDWLRGGGMIFHQGWVVNGTGLYVDAHKGKGSARAFITQNQNTETVTSEAEELPGGWIHVACTFQGNPAEPNPDDEKAVLPTNLLTLYVNGKQVAQKPMPWNSIMGGGVGWRIGGSEPGSGMGGQFNGVIDEVVVWDRVLSAEEIARHYTLGKPDPGTEVTPVAQPAAIALTAAGLPMLPQIAAHWSFDNTLAPDILGQDNLGATSWRFIRDCPAKNGAQTVKAGEPRFREGKFDAGLYLGSKSDDTELGEAVNFTLSALPQDEGSIALWFRPDWAWGKGSHTLFSCAYTNLGASIEGDRIYGYIGASDANTIVPRTTPSEWSMEISQHPWHHLVYAWYRDGTARVFLDGKDSGPVYAPLRNFYPSIIFGSDSLAGTPRDSNGNRPDAVLDELTIFSVGLSPAQVLELYQAKEPLPAQVRGLLYAGDRHAFQRGEQLDLPFHCYGAGTFTAELRHGDQHWPLLTTPAQSEVTVHCDSRELRPDDYRLAATLVTPEGQTYREEVALRIRPVEDPPIPFCALAFLASEQDEDRLVEAGIFHARTNVSTIKRLDQLFWKGLRYSPTLNTDIAKNTLEAQGIPKEEWAQRWWRPDGKTEWVTEFGPSPFSPVGQQAKRELLDQAIGWCKDHPGVRYVNLYDEYGIRMDISLPAMTYFNKQTGQTGLPDFTARKPGIYPDNDRYIQWIDTFGVDFWMNMNLGVEDRVMTEELHRFAPGLRTFSTPSSGMGEIDYENVEIYPYLLEGPLARGVGNRSELMADGLMDLYNAEQRVQPRKPQWPLLGWYNMPGQPEANESLKVLLEICLAKGAQGFLIGPDTWVRNRPDMIRSVRTTVDFTNQYGPMLKSLRFTDLGTVAVLVTEYGVMGSADPGSPRSTSWEYAQNPLLQAMRAAGVPIELITPRQVLEGRLDACEGLVLIGYTHTKQSLQDRITAFAKRGGLVWCDDTTKQSGLAPDDARPLPAFPDESLANGKAPEWEALRTAFIANLKRVPMLTGNPFLVPYSAKGEGTTVYFVINRHLFDRQQGEVSIDAAQGVVYDLLRGTVVPTVPKNGRLSWPVALDKGDWGIYVLRDAAIKAIQVTTSLQGTQVRYRARVLDAQGKPAAHVPLRIDVLDPKGQRAPYGAWLTTGATGDVVSNFTIAGLTDPPGAWHIQAKDLLSGNEADMAVTWTRQRQPSATNPLPRVLLIGDSITQGYADEVKRLLAGKAEVQLIADNAQSTDFGLQKLAGWLGGGKWDVIHFNWGLWDLCYRNPASANQGNRDKAIGKLTNTLAQYEANLRALVKQLQATHARLLWAATTPVPEGELGRIAGDEVKYNAVAARIMKEEQIAVDDLYSAILPKVKALQLPDGNVHFTDEGYTFLARQVAASIMKSLAK